MSSINNITEVLASLSDDLHKLYSAVTPENVHGEIATGSISGNEVESDRE
jgi:hypothetical protein